MAHQERIWRIHHHDRQLVQSLERAAGVSPVVAQLLACRGIVDPSSARAFLDMKLSGLHDPHRLPGVSQASQQIYQAVADQRSIVIYGDYDADGMTATAILYQCLRLLGANVKYYVPSRLEDGYGLSDEALTTLAERGGSMVISVDCGITSLAQAETAKQLGLELIITDHHQFAESLPQASVLVHPRLPGYDYPFADLCGAGVAFKLAWALCQQASQSEKVTPPLRQFLMEALGLAAIGTIADVVPLVDENRILVSHGLASLKHAPVEGLKHLMKITKLNGKPGLSSEDVAFTLAPRLNAAGRLGQAQLGVELLTTQSQERASSLAEYIHELNNSRDSLDRSIFRAANQQIKELYDVENEPALVLAGRDWHPGVIGIVAGRIAEKYHRPTVILSLDPMNQKPATGSARTAGGLDLHAAIAQCHQHLINFGGHKAAAGLKLDEDKIDAFRTDFCESIASLAHDGQQIPELEIDAETPLSLLTLRAVDEIESMAPFGQANPRPIFCATGVQLAEPPKRMGGGDRHLSVRFQHHQVRLRGVAFGKGEWAEEIQQTDGPLDIAYRPVINEFRGRRDVEVQLVDWRKSKTTSDSLPLKSPTG